MSKLKCAMCEKTFTGRKLPGGVEPVCPKCLAEIELPIVNVGEQPPESIHEEFDIGGGEDGNQD